MRTIILVMLFVAILAHLANGQEPKSVRHFADGSRIECYGTYCKRFPAAAKVIDAIPTPADIATKPVEPVKITSQPKSVLVKPASRPFRRLFFGS